MNNRMKKTSIIIATSSLLMLLTIFATDASAVLFKEEETRRSRRTATNNSRRRTTAVHPGDLIEGGFDEQPQWWHDIKNSMENQQLLRKCEFLDRIPDTGDDCPGVATQSDHYYCIFGTSEEPSWYCTCNDEDYEFHCSNSNQIIIHNNNNIQQQQQSIIPRTMRSSENDNIFLKEEGQNTTTAAIVDAIQHSVLFDESNNKNEAVRPGDSIDKDGGYQHTEHPWWYDIKTNMQNKHLLRKCDFRKTIPNTGDRCPGVATRSDHYFCIFGTSVRPSWYCTCYEHVGDYKFHCNSNTIITVDEITAFSNKNDNDNNDNDNSKYILDDLPPEQQLSPEQNNNNEQQQEEQNTISGNRITSSQKESDNTATNNNMSILLKEAEEDVMYKWGTGFAFLVGFLIGIIVAAVMITIHLRCNNNNAHSSIIDPTFATTLTPLPPTGVIMSPAKISRRLQREESSLLEEDIYV